VIESEPRREKKNPDRPGFRVIFCMVLLLSCRTNGTAVQRRRPIAIGVFLIFGCVGLLQTLSADAAVPFRQDEIA
jgi:hypothetical protein